MIKLSLWPLAPGPNYVRSSLTLLLCPSLVVIYHSLSLLETLVFTWMKRCPWIHILNTCAAFCSVSCVELEKIRSFLSTDTANKLAVSLILSRLNYCNSLLAGLPDNKLIKLLHMQNYAARPVFRKSRHACATAQLRTLHWLPVKARIQYKIACLCFQCIYRNSMPPYISDLLHPYCSSRMLRSLDT